MATYGNRLIADLPDQFKGKSRIEALMNVIGEQFDAVAKFYDDLNINRSVYTAEGLQLDKIGAILGLTRSEAKILLSADDVELSDSDYRNALLYKIMVNTSSVTYKDIIKAIKMFWDGAVYYSEDASTPATIFLETEELDGDADFSVLKTTPFIRPAGVTLNLAIKTKTEISSLHSIYWAITGASYTITPMVVTMTEPALAVLGTFVLDLDEITGVSDSVAVGELDAIILG